MSDRPQQTDLMDPTQKDITTTINELIIPEADDKAITKLDETLIQFRAALADPELGEIRKMHIQAKAITVLEDLITPGMLKDLRKLMNSPLGFKTDRDPNRPYKGQRQEEYDDLTIKRCVIVGWLAGARMVQNEFNIISSSCYLTKEFYRKAIREFPGVTNFQYALEAPVQYGERAAAVGATATWFLNGKPYKAEYRKTEDGDLRLIVISNEGMSPDALFGKAERKLFAKVHAIITGIETDVDEGEDDVPRIAASPAAEASPEQQKALEQQAEANAAFLAFAEAIEKAPGVIEVSEAANELRKTVAANDWSPELKRTFNNNITAAVRKQVEAIRGERGARSNKSRQGSLPSDQ